MSLALFSETHRTILQIITLFDACVSSEKCFRAITNLALALSSSKWKNKRCIVALNRE